MTTAPARGTRPAAPPVTNDGAPLHWLGLAKPWRVQKIAHPIFTAGSVLLAGLVVDAADIGDTLPGFGEPETSGEMLFTQMFDNVMGFGIGGFVTGAGAMLGLALTAGSRTDSLVKGYFMAAGAATGAWLSTVAATSTWSNVSMVTGLAAATFGTAFYPAARAVQQAYEQRILRLYAQPDNPATVATLPLEQVPPTIDDRHPDAARWEETMRYVGLPGLKFVRLRDSKAGYVVDLLLPSNGSVGFKEVVAVETKILGAMNMPLDTLTVEQGRNSRGQAMSRQVSLHFDVRDILSQTLPLVEDHTQISINDAFPVGMFIDGSPCNLRLREVATMIIGLRGRGKSNLMNVIVHQLSRCRDVVVWCIDLKGGRFAKPWIEAWLRGDAARPIFDWVATTRIEAHRMLVAMQAVIEHRASTGTREKEVPTREMPAVICLVDELAALVGSQSGVRHKSEGRGPTPGWFSAIMTDIVVRGRSEMVDLVVAGQRSTVTMAGGGDFKSQFEQRMGLGVSSSADASSIFEGGVAAKYLRRLTGTRTRGSMLLKRPDDERVMPAKIFRMDNDRDRIVYRASVHHCQINPPLDRGSALAADRATRAIDVKDFCYRDGEQGYLVDVEGAAAGVPGRWDTDRCPSIVGNAPPEYTDVMAEAEEDQDVVVSRSSTTVVSRPRTETTAPPQTVRSQAPARAAADDLDMQLVADAARLIIAADLGSRAMIARKLRLTYPESVRVMAELERRRIVGPLGEHGERAVLVGGTDADRYVAAILANVEDGTPPAGTAPRSPTPVEGEPIDAQVWDDLVAAFDAPPYERPQHDDGDGDPDEDGDDAVPTGHYRTVVQIVDDAGIPGISANDLVKELISRGAIEGKNRRQMYRWRDRCLEAGWIVQPSGRGGLYYSRRHQPGGPGSRGSDVD